MLEHGKYKRLFREQCEITVSTLGARAEKRNQIGFSGI